MIAALSSKSSQYEVDSLDVAHSAPLKTRAGAAALCAALSEHHDDTKTAQVFT